VAGDRPRVLVVEDDESLRRLMKKQLEANGFAVTTAEHGLEALMAVEKDRPDVLVCDISMPVLDGLEFVRALKTNEQTRSIPVVFVTGQQDPSVMVKGINVGARYYVTKPYVLAELVWKLKRIVGERQR
jgi:two-component system phosphate regulon response regulator PhoB